MSTGIQSYLHAHAVLDAPYTGDEPVATDNARLLEMMLRHQRNEIARWERALTAAQLADNESDVAQFTARLEREREWLRALEGRQTELRKIGPEPLHWNTEDLTDRRFGRWLVIALMLGTTSIGAAPPLDDADVKEYVAREAERGRFAYAGTW